MANVENNTGFSDLEYRIRKHRRQKLLVISGCLLGVAVVCVYLVNSYINRVFNSYTVTKSVERAEGNDVIYENYGTSVLKYSRDGASAIDSSGKSIWNGSYEMKNPKAQVCGDYVVIADIGGYNIVVFDGVGSGTPYTVNSPIIQAEVAKQGVVAVLMEDKQTNLIQIIDPTNVVLPIKAEVLTVVEKDGFPVDIALSDDGKKLVTSYIAVQNGIVQSFITFYSFSDVGQNEVNHLVGMKSYNSNIVADIQFFNNNVVGIYGEKSIELFSIVEKAEEIGTITFEQDIKSAFSTEQYMGFVLENDANDERNQLVVYDMSEKKVLNTTIDFSYDQVFMSGKEIIFYSDLECNIVKLNGVKKFSKTFDTNIEMIAPINHYDKYYVVNDTVIDIIKLTEE